MRIMLVTPSLANGGAQRVVARLASQLCHDHEVTVVCTYPADNRGITYPVDPAVEVVEIEAGLRWRRPITAWSFIAQNRSLAKQLRTLKHERGVDVSASFLTACNVPNVWSRGDEGVVVSIRNMQEPSLGESGLEPTTMRNLIARTSCAADLVACISQGVADEQRNLFGVPEELLRVISNPIDAEELRRRSELPLEDAAFEDFRARHELVVASMGRLVPHKCFHHLLRSFARVREDNQGAGLLVLGQGPLEQDLRALAQELGISEHVLFTGFVDNPERYLVRSDVFAMNSTQEGLCNAVLEAAALGLPVISTDCASGPREILAPGTGAAQSATDVEHAAFGVLVPNCTNSWDPSAANDASEDAMARGIAELLHDEGLRAAYRAAGALRAKDFSAPVIAQQWLRAFQEVARA